MLFKKIFQNIRPIPASLLTMIGFLCQDHLPNPKALEPPMLCEACTLVDVYSPVTSKPSKKVLVEIVTEIQGRKKKLQLIQLEE